MVVAAFMALTSAWIYGVLDRSPSPWIWASTLLVVALAHVAVGWLLGGWSFLLPGITLVLAIPAGSADTESEIPVWGFVAYYEFFATLLVAAGVAARYFSRPREERDPWA